MSEQFHTVEQAAQRLKLHPKTLLRFIREGRLRATRIGKSYRILRSDLESFAGVAAGARPSPANARVTTVIDVEPLDADACERLASLLNAAVMADAARADPVHISTAYDPAAERLKIVVIGTPSDSARLLQLVQLQLEHMR
jgi:excisionase family DNA binding protein